MRVITWNCRVGGFRKKANQIAPFRPDVLAVQEIEPLADVLLFAGDTVGGTMSGAQSTTTSYYWSTSTI